MVTLGKQTGARVGYTQKATLARHHPELVCAIRMQPSDGVLRSTSACWKCRRRQHVRLPEATYRKLFLPHIDMASGYLHNLSISSHPGKPGVEPRPLGGIRDMAQSEVAWSWT